MVFCDCSADYFFILPGLLNAPLTSTYQSESLMQNISVSTISQTIYNAVKINLIHGWRIKTTLLYLQNNPEFLYISLLPASLLFFFFIFAYKPYPTTWTQKRYVEFAFIGLMIIIVGFSPYAITRFGFDEWRVYFFSSFGAAIFIVSILFALAKMMGKKFSSILISLFSFIFLFSCMHSLLLQHQLFVNASRIQERMIVDITRQVPQFKEPVYLIILDMPARNDYLADMYFRYQFMGYALSYAYQDYKNIAGIDYCQISDDGRMISTIRDYRIRKPICNEGELQVPFETILVFQYTDESRFQLLDDMPIQIENIYPGAKSYNPSELIDLDAVTPRRTEEITKARNKF